MIFVGTQWISSQPDYKMPTFNKFELEGPYLAALLQVTLILEPTVDQAYTNLYTGRVPIIFNVDICITSGPVAALAANIPFQQLV